MESGDRHEGSLSNRDARSCRGSIQRRRRKPERGDWRISSRIYSINPFDPYQFAFARRLFPYPQVVPVQAQANYNDMMYDYSLRQSHCGDRERCFCCVVVDFVVVVQERRPFFRASHLGITLAVLLDTGHLYLNSTPLILSLSPNRYSFGQDTLDITMMPR
jgi:hypothetical protein